MQGFHAHVREGWSLFIGEWLTLKCFYRGMVLFLGRMAYPRIPPQREYWLEGKNKSVSLLILSSKSFLFYKQLLGAGELKNFREDFLAVFLF